MVVGKNWDVGLVSIVVSQFVITFTWCLDKCLRWRDLSETWLSGGILINGVKLSFSLSVSMWSVKSLDTLPYASSCDRLLDSDLSVLNSSRHTLINWSEKKKGFSLIAAIMSSTHTVKQMLWWLMIKEKRQIKKFWMEGKEKARSSLR